MKFVILDVYPDKKHRLVKDTAGGYGTGNDFGNSFFSKFLNIYVDQNIGMPAIEVMIISSILKQDNEVYYTRNLKDEKILDCDYVIFPSSIIAHETELSTLSKLENKIGFSEKTKKINFFRKGAVDEWKTKLSPELIKKIENSFNKQMKELGYL